jgi:teichuronic acid biosynthesis glycosyltransferase TuaC
VILFPSNAARSFNKGYDLFERVRTLLGPSVRWLVGGGIPFEQMPTYVNAADVVLQTSRFEASPMIAKEALACNRPFVSTDVGDVRELFGETIGCLLTTFEAEDIAAKIEQALTLNASELDSRSRIAELRLSVQDIARKYVQLYEEVAAGA